jgi:hypothetical protein
MISAVLVFFAYTFILELGHAGGATSSEVTFVARTKVKILPEKIKGKVNARY